jgi:hypothetical protein
LNGGRQRGGEQPSGGVADADAQSNTVLRERVVVASDFLTGNTYDRFIRFSVPVTVTSAANSLELRVWWYGSNRLDIAGIRVR